jgi:hypothetical protein
MRGKQQLKGLRDITQTAPVEFSIRIPIYRQGEALHESA